MRLKFRLWCVKSLLVYYLDKWLRTLIASITWTFQWEFPFPSTGFPHNNQPKKKKDLVRYINKVPGGLGVPNLINTVYHFSRGFRKCKSYPDILYIKLQKFVRCDYFSQKPHHQFWWNFAYISYIVWRWFWSNMGSYYP